MKNKQTNKKEKLLAFCSIGPLAWMTKEPVVEHSRRQRLGWSVPGGRAVGLERWSLTDPSGSQSVALPHCQQGPLIYEGCTQMCTVFLLALALILLNPQSSRQACTQGKTQFPPLACLSLSALPLGYIHDLLQGPHLGEPHGPSF
jgi:hypothetical protein